MKPYAVNSPLIPPMRAKISHAKIHNGMVYVSGMVGRELSTGKVIEGGVGPQTRQTLINLGHVLEAAGTNFEHVITTNCYISDQAYFDDFNKVWEEFFPENPPTRICIQVILGPSFDIEIDATAAIPGH